MEKGVGAEDSRVLRGAGDDLQPGDEQLSCDQLHHIILLHDESILI